MSTTNQRLARISMRREIREREREREGTFLVLDRATIGSATVGSADPGGREKTRKSMS